MPERAWLLLLRAIQASENRRARTLAVAVLVHRLGSAAHRVQLRHPRAGDVTERTGTIATAVGEDPTRDLGGTQQLGERPARGVEVGGQGGWIEAPDHWLAYCPRSLL